MLRTPVKVLALIWLTSLAHATDPASGREEGSRPEPRREGFWVTRDPLEGLPSTRLKVDSRRKKVTVTFLKETPVKSPSIGVSFEDAAGRKTWVELKAMDPLPYPSRYEGSLTRAEPFVGFEIKIPLYKTGPAVIESRQMQEVKK